MKPTKKEDKYYLAKTIQHGNATIHIYRPILTDEERKKREKHIISVAERMLSKYDNLYKAWVLRILMKNK